MDIFTRLCCNQDSCEKFFRRLGGEKNQDVSKSSEDIYQAIGWICCWEKSSTLIGSLLMLFDF